MHGYIIRWVENRKTNSRSVFPHTFFSTFDGGNENASRADLKVPHRKKCVATLVSREGPATALFLPHCLLAFYKEKLSSKGKF